MSHALRQDGMPRSGWCCGLRMRATYDSLGDAIYACRSCSAESLRIARPGRRPRVALRPMNCTRCGAATVSTLTRATNYCSSCGMTRQNAKRAESGPITFTTHVDTPSNEEAEMSAHTRRCDPRQPLLTPERLVDRRQTNHNMLDVNLTSRMTSKLTSDVKSREGPRSSTWRLK